MPLNKVNLNAVTAATDGKGVDVKSCEKKTVCVAVSGNTGAVTVTIQHSPTNAAPWFTLDEKTYTALNQNDDWSYHSHFRFIRTKTSTHANATVTTTITGRDPSAS